MKCDQCITDPSLSSRPEFVCVCVREYLHLCMYVHIFYVYVHGYVYVYMYLCVGICSMHSSMSGYTY